jgi:hypothetical protein
MEIFAASHRGKLRVEQRFETSVTVQDEGPHLDLTWWQHGYSRWRSLGDVTGKGEVRAISQSETVLRYPQGNIADALAAIKAQGGTRWFECAKRAPALGAYPVVFGVSEVQFRISEWNRGKWNVRHVLHFIVPMGC